MHLFNQDLDSDIHFHTPSNGTVAGDYVFYSPATGLSKVKFLTSRDYHSVCKVLDVENGCFIIPPGNEATMKSYGKTVQCCVFNAVKEYLQAWFGLTLDSKDRDWYSSQPEVSSGGLAENSSLSVVSKLLYPYGIGIKKVYIKKGRFPQGDWLEWMNILGCNPKAISDLSTTNQEFLESLPAENQEAYKDMILGLGVEFIENLPQKGLVIFQNNVVGNHALGGGHATYKSPRSMVKTNFSYAIELDRLENCKYLQNPINMEDPLIYETLSSLDLNLGECKDKNGDRLSKIFNYYPTSYKGSYNSYSPGSPVDNSKKKSDSQGTKELPILDPIELVRRKTEPNLRFFLESLQENLGNYGDFEFEYDPKKVLKVVKKWDKGNFKTIQDDLLSLTIYEIYKAYEFCKEPKKKLLEHFKEHRSVLSPITGSIKDCYEDLIIFFDLDPKLNADFKEDYPYKDEKIETLKGWLMLAEGLKSYKLLVSGEEIELQLQDLKLQDLAKLYSYFYSSKYADDYMTQLYNIWKLLF